MTSSLANLWQFHTEFTLLLCFTLLARFVIRRQKKNHQAYLVWLCLPIGLMAAYLVSSLVNRSQALPLNSQLLQQYLRQPVETLSQVPASNTPSLLAWLWLTVALAAVGRLVWQHFKLRQSLRVISRDTQHELSSKYPIITVDSEDLSPAVYGFIQPKIYLPLQVQNKLSHEQLCLITRHEEQHIRQGHLWLNLMWDVLVCLLWFNPLVYLARQQFRHDQELYCDYLVLNAQDEDSSRSYGHALLTTITATHSVSLLCSWNAFNQLEERIMNIKSASQKSGKGLLLLATLAIFSATSLYAIGGQGEKGERKEIRKEVMIKKGEGDKKLVKIRKNDLEFIEENGKRHVVEDGNKRAMTEEESREFDAEKQEIDQYTVSDFDHEHGHKMIRIEKDSDHDGDHTTMKKRVKIVKDNKVFEQQDGELFIIENDQKRSATVEEAKEFEKEMQEAKQYIREVEIEKELDAVRHHDIEFEVFSEWMDSEHLEFERFDAEFEKAAEALKEIEVHGLISEEELQQAAEVLEEIKVRELISEKELQKAAESLKEIKVHELISEKELQRAAEALEEIDFQKMFSETEMLRQREAIEAAREGWNIDEEKIRQSLEVARVQMEKYRQRWEDEQEISQPH